jgi:hypothetical protein
MCSMFIYVWSMSIHIKKIVKYELTKNELEMNWYLIMS